MRTRYRLPHVLFCLAVLLWLSPATGQYASDPPPVDSPYWWTLSDEIEPQALYDALQSRERNQARLRQAILEGRHAFVPDDRIGDLSLFIDGKTTPELFPMWEVFNSFSIRFSGARPDYEDTAKQDLTSAGLSPAGVSQVIAHAYRAWNLRQETIGRVDAEQRQFAYEILAPAQRAYGRGRAAEMIKGRQFGRLARISGYDRQTVERLYNVWRVDPSATAAVETLERLRTVLSDEDWEMFRHFLLTKVASRLSYHYFDERALR